MHESNIFNRARSGMAGVALGFLLCCSQAAMVQGAQVAQKLYTFRAGLHLSREHPPTSKQLAVVIKGLRFWTGLTELTADNGIFAPGDRSRIVGGSAHARELIFAAVDGRDSFTLESRDHSPAIAFAQIEAVDDYVDAGGERHGVWRLRIDFSDFTNLRGDNTAIVSFSPASNMLHELAHGVLKLRDTISRADQLGDCERHINRIRVELGLPQRQNYFPYNRRAVTIESPVEVLQGELRFVHTSERTPKMKTLLLTFNLERVCEVRKSRSSSGELAQLIGWTSY